MRLSGITMGLVMVGESAPLHNQSSPTRRRRQALASSQGMGTSQPIS